MHTEELNPLVVALAYDGLCTFEFGITTEIFALPRPEVGEHWYRFAVAAAHDGPLRGMGGIRIEPDGGLELLAQAAVIVVPGWKSVDAPISESLAQALVGAVGRGARLVSICSGAFVLARAGVLNGRRATTHWRYAARLARWFPDVQVLPDVLYVDDGGVLTSAGSAAGIDACLHLVRADFGTDMSNRVARRLVVSPHRDGGQAQFIERPVTEPGADEPLRAVMQWATARLHESLPIERLAARALMSKRTLVRRFQASVGQSPGQWVGAQRLARAKMLLEHGELSIDEVAVRVGFGSAATLRHHFRHHLRVSPSAYKAQFRRTARAPGAPI